MADFEINIIDKISNLFDDNVDVEITLSNNNAKYIVTFFTLDNIKKIMNRYESSGECLNGSYFWASSMIIVKDLKIERAWKTFKYEGIYLYGL